MQRLLIANRGEIAVRIIRACRELGIHSIAVCSEADLKAMHVRMADSYTIIGPAPASESYLSIPALLNAARKCRADAVHPGYGFLSERAEFAEACVNAGLVFVGPESHVIRSLGDKIEARAAMDAAGVPVTPGYSGSNQSDAKLRSEARAIGYPVLIKAAAGGGGRGMRLVPDASQFDELLLEARTESMAAFGDDRVLLERYVLNARHVEVQIVGDIAGNVIHLFERDCSIQRRHQKIVEESPCSALTPELRDKITAAAVLAGKTAGYTNAGTVEFLLEQLPDGERRFYFMEVNTRLQVEHPVSEAITGVDLVHLQLIVASGNTIPYSQESIAARGHAIEVRIYAEDPALGFLPSTGKIDRWIEPQGPGVRVDSGVEEGDEVSPYYDPMLAKLIVHASSRDLALNRLRAALGSFVVLGLDTNIAYLMAIEDNNVYRSGGATTHFLSENLASWTPIANVPDQVLFALAATQLSSNQATSRPGTVGPARRISPWHSAGSWRNS